MKFSYLVATLCIAFVSQSVLAQPSRQIPTKRGLLGIVNTPDVATKAPTVSIPSDTVMQGFNIGVLYSMANSWKMKGNLAGLAPIDMTIETENAPGVGLRYAIIRSGQIGFLGGVSYQFEREIKKATLSGEVDGKKFSSTDENIDGSPKFSLLVVEPNATIGIDKNVYLLAGPNYVVPFQSGNWGELEMKGDLGAQIGAGLAVSNFFGELQYQALNPKFETTGVTLNESRLWGFSLRAGATF